MFKNNQGQALLEISITIGIAAIVIAALAITTLVGLKNAQFSQNQAQATKLAQEGLEKVRSIRSLNTPLCQSDLTTIYYWYLTPTITENDLIWENSLGQEANCQDCKYLLNQSSFCGLQASSNRERLQNGKFLREIIIEDVPKTSGAGISNNQKRIKAKVYWSDYSGEHSSELTTILANY